jgi:hypothetical protein
MVNCPFVLGQRVTVSPRFTYAEDWPGEYLITGVTWNYQEGNGQGINIWIAHPDDVKGRYGSTDGFSVDDLLPVGSREVQTSHCGDNGPY